jgi:hypothetical protein
MGGSYRGRTEVFFAGQNCIDGVATQQLSRYEKPWFNPRKYIYSLSAAAGLGYTCLSDEVTMWPALIQQPLTRAGT